MSNANFEDGKKASVALQTSIIDLLETGADPRSIALVTASIGVAMLKDHYGADDSYEITLGLLGRAQEGSLATYPALRAANQNIENQD
jgi:hypothetical protein